MMKRVNQRNILQICGAFALISLLSACGFHRTLQRISTTTQVADTALHGPCGRVGQSLSQQMPGQEIPLSQNKQLLQALKLHHVQVIPVGDTVTLLLFSDEFFAASDDVLRHRDYPALDLVAKLLHNYGNAAVKVGVSHDDVDSQAQNHVLSLRRAQRIASYLWRRGISAWRLYPQSIDQTQRFAHDHNAFASRQNRRVEITFNPLISPNLDCKTLHHLMKGKPSWLD